MILLSAQYTTIRFVIVAKKKRFSGVYLFCSVKMCAHAISSNLNENDPT